MRTIKLKIEEILVLIYLTLYCLKYYTNLNMEVTTAAIAGYGFVCFCYLYQRHKELRGFLNLLLLLGAFSAIASRVNGNKVLIYVFLQLSLECLGVLLYVCRERLRRIRGYSKFLFGVLCVLMVLAYWSREKNQGIYISDSLSSNSFSVFALFFIAILVLDCLWNHRRYPYASIVAALLLAVLAEGMGGVITIALLLLGLLLKSRNNTLSIGKMIFFLGMAFVALFLLGQGLEHLLSIALDDNGRFAIWKYYLELAFGNIQNMLFGANISGNGTLMFYKNMHNTFLNYHYFFGSAVLLFFVILIAIQEYKFIKEKKFVLFLILNILALRSLTDAAELYSAIWIFMFLSECRSRDTEKTHEELAV